MQMIKKLEYSDKPFPKEINTSKPKKARVDAAEVFSLDEKYGKRRFVRIELHSDEIKTFG